MPLLHVQAGSADQLQDIADALWKARKVVVITGAGISTNSGIPDFRSENGLYSMIQSQFDAASKLGMPKAEIPSAMDERPRKRRKTTPPMQDSIEVAHERSADLGTSSAQEVIVAVTDDIAPKIEASINVIPTVSHTVADRLLACDAEKHDKSSEIPDAMDDEVVLLCEHSILAGEHPFSEDQDNHEDGGAKEEVPDPPDRTSGKERESLGKKQHRSIQVNPQAVSSVRSPKHLSRPLAQTTTSSPLSSPPPADLFDSFNVQLTDPPPSSTRPSSPVSTENGDEEEDNNNDDDDDNEPSVSQDYMKQSSFRRSLSTLKGKELFDASIWADPLKTSVFYTFATNLRQKSRDADPTGCHQFISHLSKAGKMVRCYTQNIDQLEDKVGLSTRLLLGAGSRSRFSTRTTKGSISASLGATGPKESTLSNTEPTLLPSVIRAVSPPQLGVDAPAVLQEITASNSQNAPSELLEVNVDNRRTSGADRTLVETCSAQDAKHGEGHEQDGAKADAPPADARSSMLDKSMPGTDCATPTTPEHDRGVECVFLHGSLRALRCFQCGCVSDWEGARELQTMSGQQPPCPRCEDATNARQERGKRALGVGKLRPDIVLYGEDHPESQQISSIIQHDISLAPDMLIIMGTSLKVHGLKTVVREFAKTVHNRKDGKVIFVNYTKPAESVWADVIDFWVQMDCDSWVADLKDKKPIIWMPPGTVEDESRATASKRRRTLADEADKSDNKKQKRVESVVEAAITVPVKSAVKRPKPVKTVELSKPADAKPAVPKRPAAHRDCKHNAAYWTTKIMADLAKMTGRVVKPGPPPYRTAPAIQNIAPQIDAPGTETAASTKIRRGPRTKNTRSRKVHEAAVIPGWPEKKPTVRKGKTQGAPATKAPPKRRTKSSGPTITPEIANGAGQLKDALLIKQDSETPDTSILVEVQIPNSGPPVEDDLPMVSIVKNRIRKPKVFYGDTNPLLSASVQRSAPTGNARPRAQSRTAKMERSEQSTRPDAFQNGAGGMHSIEEFRLPPLLQLRPQPPQSPITPTAPEFASQIGSLRVMDQQTINTRRDSFFQVALAQPHSPDSVPPPEYLEPLVSPGPRDISPKMSPNYRQKHDVSPKLSPNHWQKFAYAYSNALHRSPFEDFNSLRSGNAGMSFHAHHQPVQHMASSANESFLEAGPSIVPSLSVPTMAVSQLAAGDSPDWQLHSETADAEADAAATLLQMPYDPRHFAQT